MNVPLIDEIAAHIRRVDGSHELSPSALGHEIAVYLYRCGLVGNDAYDSIEDFVYRATIGSGYLQPKPLGPEALAELIVAEFRLDEVAR